MTPPTTTQHKGSLAAAGLTLIAVIAVLSDVVGLVNFGTGKNAPDIFGTGTSQARPSSSTDAVVIPTLSSVPQTTTSLTSPDANATPTSAAPAPPTGQPSSRTPQTTGPVPLSSLQPVFLGSDVDTDVTVALGRTQMDGSILYQCSMPCNEVKGVVDYLIPNGAKSFTSYIGVTDDATEANQVGTFEIWLDNIRMKTFRAAYGKPVKVTYALERGVRLRLVAFRPGTVENPILQGANAAGGTSNNPPSLAWGSPAFIT